MIKRTLQLIAAFLFMIGLMTLPAQAQAPTATTQGGDISFGIAGGPSFPTATLGDAVDTGFHVQGLVDGIFPGFPVGVRADVAYHQFPDVIDGHSRHYNGTLNGRVEIPGLPAAPYLIGGVGIYGHQFTDAHNQDGTTINRSTDLQTNAGINGGIGVRLGQMAGVNAFVETRYHHVFGGDINNQFVPLTIGVML